LEVADGVIYEVIVVTWADQPHPAPIGVKKVGASFEATVYHDTTTYKNLKGNPNFTVNIVGSGLLFYEAVHLKSKLALGKHSQNWFLVGADAWMDAQVLEELPGQGKSVFRFNVGEAHGVPKKPRPYTRADGALVEMLVHASRIAPYLSAGMVDDARKLYSLIEHYYSLIGRIAPNTLYQAYADSVYREAARRLGGHPHG
jgi:hypothetical protein